MRLSCCSKSDQRGMILVTVLLIIFLLIAVGIGSVVSVQNSYRASVNLRSGASALYLAEAGVEWAKDQVGAATVLPPPLVNADRRLSAGSFALTVLNSTQVSPLTAQVNVRSTGALSDSAQTVQAGISKSYDLTDGALVLRGESRGVRFTGETFLIDGRDRDPVTQAVVAGAKPRLGISFAGPALLAQLNDALSSAQVSNIVSAESGRAAVAPSGWIGSDAIARLAVGVCGAPLAHVSFVAAMSNLMLTERALGSRSSPEIYCFEGTTGSGDSVVFNGNVNGAGILIVRNAELVLSGTFAWEGLVIVTGREVGVRVTEVVNKDVVGSLVINETGNVLGSGPLMADVQGNVRLLYSRQALDLAARLIPTSTLQSSYADLPFTLSQDYWRLVTP